MLEGRSLFINRYAFKQEYFLGPMAGGKTKQTSDASSNARG